MVMVIHNASAIIVVILRSRLMLQKKYIEKVLHISEYEVGNHVGEFPLFTCPDCDTDSMVKTDSSYFCFCCGTKYQLNEMKYCERCGELFFPIDDDFICKDCMDGQINER